MANSRLKYIAIACIVGICSLSLTIYSFNNTTPESKIIDDNYEDISGLGFIALGDVLDVNTSKNKLNISWEILNSKEYVSAFEGSVSHGPGKHYSGAFAELPEGARCVQLDFSLKGSYINNIDNGYSVAIYLIGYDDNRKQCVSNILYPQFQNSSERGRPYSLKMNINNQCRYFNILIKIMPDNEKSEHGYIDLYDMDIIFK